MPTYQYACTECGDQLEAVQKFSDDPLTVHDACGGRLRKVFSPVGIVFKGSGFYRTDSRNGSASKPKTAEANGSPAARSESAADAAAPAGKAEAKPAEKAAAASGSSASGEKAA